MAAIWYGLFCIGLALSHGLLAYLAEGFFKRAIAHLANEPASVADHALITQFSIANAEGVRKGHRQSKARLSEFGDVSIAYFSIERIAFLQGRFDVALHFADRGHQLLHLIAPVPKLLKVDWDDASGFAAQFWAFGFIQPSILPLCLLFWTVMNLPISLCFPLFQAHQPPFSGG